MSAIHRPGKGAKLTARGNVGSHFIDVLGEDNGEAGIEVIVDVAVEEPGTGVVGAEADGNVIAGGAGADDVALGGVDVVVSVAAGGADDPEFVLCAKEWDVNLWEGMKVGKLTPWRWRG